MTKYKMTRTRTRPIRSKLRRAWIPEKGELSHLILPSDSRYYEWSFCGGPPLIEEKRQITDWVFGLIQSDILRVLPQEMLAKLPKHLPRDILRTWAKSNNIPRERVAWWMDRVDRASTDWCHHDPEMGYLVAKLLCVRFRSRLLQGWRVWGAPEYAGA